MQGGRERPWLSFVPALGALFVSLAAGVPLWGVAAITAVVLVLGFLDLLLSSLSEDDEPPPPGH